MQQYKEIIFATSNAHKVAEVDLIFQMPSIKLRSLKDIKFTKEIVEDGHTFRENALLKVQAIAKEGYTNIIGEDAGLEVEALNGEPGIYSARYSGEPVNHARNIQKLLKNLEGATNRKARFVSTVCFMDEGIISYFEGYIHGEICMTETGKKGFGYDPIFKPNGYQYTFAEMEDQLKSSISHRYKSFTELAKYLRSKNPQ